MFKINGTLCKKAKKIILYGNQLLYSNMLTIKKLMKMVEKLFTQMFGHASANRLSYKMEQNLNHLQNSGFQLE